MVVQNNVLPAVQSVPPGTSLSGSISSNGTSTAAFASQLASEIESFLSQSSNGSQIEIDVQNSATSGEYTITVKDPAAATSSPAAAATAPPAAATLPDSLMDAHVPLVANTAASVPISTPNSAAAAAVAKSNMTPDDAYWAAQPPAVQALQNMDPTDRVTAAQTLAKQGYTIDVPIMAWGWDPLTTMVERQNYGYTWIPSALQSPVLPPGVSYPGVSSYDPSNPPAGSIPVSTAFAAGTNMQNMYIDSATIAASIAASPIPVPGSDGSQTSVPS
jgi:hypothetical protein